MIQIDLVSSINQAFGDRRQAEASACLSIHQQLAPQRGNPRRLRGSSTYVVLDCSATMIGGPCANMSLTFGGSQKPVPGQEIDRLWRLRNGISIGVSVLGKAVGVGEPLP